MTRFAPSAATDTIPPPHGHKVPVAGLQIPRPTAQNFFSGTEIYFKGTKIYFQASEIYFKGLEIVFVHAAENLQLREEKIVYL